MGRWVDHALRMTYSQVSRTEWSKVYLLVCELVVRLLSVDVLGVLAAGLAETGVLCFSSRNHSKMVGVAFATEIVIPSFSSRTRRDLKTVLGCSSVSLNRMSSDLTSVRRGRIPKRNVMATRSVVRSSSHEETLRPLSCVRYVLFWREECGRIYKTIESQQRYCTVSSLAGDRKSL